MVFFSVRRRIGPVVVALAVFLVPGCLSDPRTAATTAGGESPAGSELWWSTRQNGTIIVGFSFESEQRAECRVTRRSQGVADKLMPVDAVVVSEVYLDESIRGPRLEVERNSYTVGIPNHAVAVAADETMLSLDERRYLKNWIANGTGTFSSVGSGHVWIIAIGAEAHGQPEREREPWAVAMLGQDTVQVGFSCDGAWTAGPVRLAQSAILLTDPPEAGLLHVRSSPAFTAAYVGVGNDLEWTADGNVSFYGWVGGDPEKTVLVELAGPHGSKTWYALPTTYLHAIGAGVGDIFMVHTGPPGAYRLSFSGWGSIFITVEAVVVVG